MSTPTLHVYRNQVVDWFVAESAQEASELCRRHYRLMNGAVADDDDLDLDFEQEPDDKPLTINGDEGKITKTCTEWTAEGRGFLCSTEW